jgi:hypothetical protein
VTFINTAQKSGKIGATIHFKRKDGTLDSCKVIGTTTHAVGTSTLIKASLLATDIQIQCPHDDVQATNAGSAVKILAGTDVVITEIDIDDGTDQQKTINPQSLDMDGCGSSASISAAGKTGFQVAQAIVANVTNCDAASGSSITALDLGGGVGEIAFVNLSNAHSVVTFNPGGNFGLTDHVIMEAPYATITIPTISEWGFLALIVSLGTVGALMLWRMSLIFRPA